MAFIFLLFLLHLHDVLFDNVQVQIMFAIFSQENEHPDKNIVAGRDFVDCEEFESQLFKGVFVALTNVFSENRQEGFFGSINNDLVPSFMNIGMDSHVESVSGFVDQKGGHVLRRFFH